MNQLEMIASNPLVYRLACGLVHSLWEGLLIAVALALLLPSLRGRPSARYTAAWLSLVLMACSVPLTVWLVPGPSRPQIVVPAPVAAPERVAVSENDDLAPLASGTNRQAMPASLGPIAPVALARPASIPKEDGVSPRQGRLPTMPDLRWIVRRAAPWTVAAWLVGIVLLSLWRLGGWLYLHQLCRRGATPAPESVSAILDRLQDRLGIRCAVRLLESARVHVPAVIGWLCPVVLVPFGLLGGMTPQQVELILAHELAHIRRHDFLANLIQTAIETCLFYHPAVWWVSRKVRDEREACCDDFVVAATGERLLYARALARLAEYCVESRGLRLGQLPVAADGGDLLARIRRLVGPSGLEHRPAHPQLVGSVAVLGFLATLAGYVALAVAPPTSAQQEKSTAPRAESKTKPAASPAVDERPRIVEVRPADGATDVEPDSNIRIRFDRPMSPTQALLEWERRGQAGYRLRGAMHYDPAAHEFTLPVRLTPARKHDVTLNHKDFARAKEYEGFRAAEGRSAAPFRWSFTTAQPKATAGARAPRVVSVSPASDTEVALLTPVEVTFDEPMDPACYGVSVPGELPFNRAPELADHAAYDPAAKRFTLLLQLPPNWNGELRLEAFRGTNGAAAEPVLLRYRTLREPLAPALRSRVEQASHSARLRELIERIRAASQKITSVSENVLTTYTLHTHLPDWYDRYWTQGAAFKRQGTDKFVAVVDEIMRVPFRVGSDGKMCWFVGSNERVVLPREAVLEKNVLFVAPFDASGKANVESIIRDRKLDYAGEVDLDGRRCHLIRSWEISMPAGLGVIQGPRWYIDAATWLPARVAQGDSYAVDYTYTRINEPIPDDEFRPAAGDKVDAANPEPLPEGYTRRFLNVIDGTNGRMSVRWGMKGPKGWNSSGLN